MIAKFNDDQDIEKTIEFSEDVAGYLSIQCNSINGVLLTEKDLFELIGFLLRVQSNFKKSSHGKA